jgi:UDP-N-acetylmuramoyl-tripeptide--D-alanyl-D-alanine ligase
MIALARQRSQAEASPPLWTAGEAAGATNGRSTADWSATGVAIDSRKVAAGDLFVALRGPNFDGHDFAGAAFAGGAAAALVNRVPAAAAGRPLLLVEDTQAGIEALGRGARERCRGKFIAVTGSVGKTGTKEALRVALEEHGPTYASAGNLNNQWGVPLSLARLPPQTAFGVFELGMNHAGEIGPLSRQVRPHVAIITNVEAVHLEFFPSVEAIADAKAEIFEGMDSGGVAVLNRDSPLFDRLRAAAERAGVGRVIGFGKDLRAEARLIECSLHASCSAVTAAILGERLDYSLPFPGVHHVHNSLAVLAAVKLAGGDVGTAAAALARLSPLEGRGRRLRVAVDGGSFEVIDESYNASPVAVRAAFSVLAQARPASGGRRVAVLGDMLELGAEAPRLHEALAKPAVDAGIDLVLTAGPLMGRLSRALPAERRGPHAADSAALVAMVLNTVRPGDVVLVKGSLGSRMKPIVEALAGLGARRPAGSP